MRKNKRNDLRLIYGPLVAHADHYLLARPTSVRFLRVPLFEKIKI